VALSKTEVNYPGPAGAECPWPLLAKLRDEAPVYELPAHPGVFLVTSYRDIRTMLGDPDRFSSDAVRSGLGGFNLAGSSDLQGRTMNETDDPAHAAKRRLAFAPLKPGRLKSYEPLITGIVDSLIDGFIADGRVEFVEQFANPVPARVICLLMGLPPEDEELVQRFGRIELSGLVWMDEAFKQRQLATAAKMVEYLTDRIQERYEEPGDDVISIVIQEQVERDGEFHPDDVRAQAALLLGGGVMTTAHFLSSAMYLLVTNPEQMTRVRDKSLLPAMIDEVLRLEPPSVWQPRRATQDVVLSGVTVPAGSYLLMMLGSANRDEQKFDCPTEFDVDRPATKDHLSFGYGTHFCLGAPLARTESRIAFERLFARMGNIRATADNSFEHVTSAAFRGLVRLSLEFDPV
jgi:cytochrome P450